LVHRSTLGRPPVLSVAKILTEPKPFSAYPIMKTQPLKLVSRLGHVAVILLLLASAAPSVLAQNTAVNYLGDLTGTSGPVTGTYDFKFRLFEKESGSPQLGNTVFKTGVPVQNGSFAVSLDFGIVLLPITYFIEVSVKPAGPGDYVLLLPLQKFSPFATAQTADVANLATYANNSGISGYATNAGSANFANTSGTSGFATNAGFANTAGVAMLASNVAPNSVGTVALQDNSVTEAKIPPGTVVRSLNTLTDHVLLAPGPNIFISSSNQTITVSASAAVGGSGWGFTGNTVAGEDFLGTLNAQALEFRVNGLRALQLSPNAESHNVLGGSFANGITNDAVGVVIAGGGNANGPQLALGSYAVLGGGWSNSAAALAVVGGGFGNQALGTNSVIGGGHGNQAPGANSVVAGGVLNQAFGVGSVISGGGKPETDFPSGPAEPNVVEGDYSVISGGRSNYIAYVPNAVIGGGRRNMVEGEAGVIGGGFDNHALGYGSVVSGGLNNEASGNQAVISGGLNNQAFGDGSVVPGGMNNTASGNGSLAAGFGADAFHLNSFVWSDGQWPHGQSTDDYQFVVDAAGGLHLVNDTGLNFAGDGQLTFGGGDRVLIEFPDTIGNLGVDGDEVYFTSAGSFAWRKQPFGPNLMRLDNNELRVNGTFVSASDRNLKENFQPVNPQEILARVAALPIARWNYKANARITHVGPMAQDFHTAFGVGTDDKTISMVDADGVALAAIQGLNAKVESGSQQTKTEMAELRAENAVLKARLDKLEQLLSAQNTGVAQ
jgi:hypothetical protein